jgi:hypothetical protein
LPNLFDDGKRFLGLRSAAFHQWCHDEFPALLDAQQGSLAPMRTPLD